MIDAKLLSARGGSFSWTLCLSSMNYYNTQCNARTIGKINLREIVFESRWLFEIDF